MRLLMAIDEASDDGSRLPRDVSEFERIVLYEVAALPGQGVPRCWRTSPPTATPPRRPACCGRPPATRTSPASPTSSSVSSDPSARRSRVIMVEPCPHPTHQAHGERDAPPGPHNRRHRREPPTRHRQRTTAPRTRSRPGAAVFAARCGRRVMRTAAPGQAEWPLPRAPLRPGPVGLEVSHLSGRFRGSLYECREGLPCRAAGKEIQAVTSGSFLPIKCAGPTPFFIFQ